MAKTLFERLIDRELPCHIVYEDAQVFAFLDRAPKAHGHTLVVSKEAAATLDALSDSAAAALGAALPRVCRAVQRASGTTAYNVLQNNGSLAGQEVPHVHFHIVPKPKEDGGLRVDGDTARLNDAEAEPLAAAMRAELLD